MQAWMPWRCHWPGHTLIGEARDNCDDGAGPEERNSPRVAQVGGLAADVLASGVSSSGFAAASCWPRAGIPQ